MRKLKIFITFMLVFILSEIIYSQQYPAWVHFFKGDVKIKFQNSNLWKNIKLKMAVKPGDVIKTGKNSYAVIAFENAALTRIMPNSEVEISKLNYIEKEKKSESKIKILSIGKLVSVIKKLSKEQQNEVEVETPTAVMGVRGTDIMVDVPDENTSVFAVFEGKVVVKDFATEAGVSKDDMKMLLDFLHEISIESGQYSVYIKDKGFKKAESIGQKFNNSQQIAKELKIEFDKIDKEISDKTREKFLKESTEIREATEKEN